MTKRALAITAVGVVAVAIVSTSFLLRETNVRVEIGPAILPVDGDVAELLRNHAADARQPAPLAMPEGFSISIFAEHVNGARVIVKDAKNDYWVSQPSQNRIAHLAGDGFAGAREVGAITGLDAPHGIAFDPKKPGLLYIAQMEELSRVRTDDASGAVPERVAELQRPGEQGSRNLGFGPDGRLYVSLGATCNVCVEKDRKHASVMVWNGGDDFTKYAGGLRSATFFMWDPVDDAMWATEMGRDLIGNDYPPDELDRIVERGDYGWPRCYGKNVVDRDFDPTLEGIACVGKVAPEFEIPAHSSPLGLAVAPDSWGDGWKRDLIVAYHGSWNRDKATGYKLVRIRRNDDTGAVEGAEDFITGWLVKDGSRALGRPAGVLTDGDAVLVTDDKAGVIYRITKK